MFARIAIVAWVALAFGCQHGPVATGSAASANTNDTSSTAPTTSAQVDGDAPRNLRLAHGKFGLDLAWSVPANGKVDGYRIYRSDDGGATFKKIEELAGREEHEFTDASRIKAKTTYIYFVRSYTSSRGDGGASNKCSITTAPFVMTSPNTAEIDLAWVPSTAPDVHEYAVYRSRDMNFKPSPETLITIVEEPHYEDTGLERNTTYMYHVMCIHDNSTRQTPVDESTAPPKDR
jgi:fibronectin type 3 domain-containing protein